MKLEGELYGLKPQEIKAIERLYKRRYAAAEGFTTDQLRELASLSHSVFRQLAVLIDRAGRVQYVVVGDASRIVIPVLSRTRQTEGRLRGLRLLHTHLTPKLLSREDLMDLLSLRLDDFAVLTVDQFGAPLQFQHAHLLPPDAGEEPYRVIDPIAWDKVVIDFKTQVETLEDEMARSAGSAKAVVNGQVNGLLVSVSSAPYKEQEKNLIELEELANTAGVAVVGKMTQRVSVVNPKSILSVEKLAELEVLALQGHANLIIFDNDLSAAQLRNITGLTERKVINRTQLILDIFAQRAVSSAGKLQVEMAQLQFAQSRLVGQSTAFDRLMGGIGGRGPGETKLETDRRRIKERIARIKKELEELRKHRGYARARRSRQELPLASLVGYTNAGKSTLFNALTQAKVFAENKLFATLDPTTRRLRVPNDQEVILADTVGFIRQLPKELVEAFKATLEELTAADVLLHVVDASNPEVLEQYAAVRQILTTMKLEAVEEIVVLNKWDLLEQEQKELLIEHFPAGIPVSAVTRFGLDMLVQTIQQQDMFTKNMCGKQIFGQEEYTEEYVDCANEITGLADKNQADKNQNDKNKNDDDELSDGDVNGAESFFKDEELAQWNACSCEDKVEEDEKK